jgi:hypothetical protein
MNDLRRRQILRGVLGGAAVTVGLPFLNCFLDDNGTALAATGAPLPVRFGTWFWGLGYTPSRWVPQTVGENYDLPPEIKYIEPYKNKINVLSGFDVKLDGRPNSVHYSGTFGMRLGVAPDQPDKSDLPTLDVIIGDAIGNGMRFKSLDVAATGNATDSYSRRTVNDVNPGEGSPIAFYTRVFGPDFRDPNAADFKPDPDVMLRLSVLSSIKDQRDALIRYVGSEDKARLDQYFTSLRQVEQQLQLQLEKPPRAEACHVPTKPVEAPIGYQVDNVIANHRLMAQLVAMALACNQTRVFNVVYSDSRSQVHRAGSTTIHHQYTHEEPIDKDLGYQVQSGWFVERSMEAWATFVATLASFKEGDGTLLDNSLVLAHSDTSFAKTHLLQGVPAMTAGSAGGRLKTGIHVATNGDPVSRIGLTMQQAMRLPVERWGVGTMETNQPISQLLA